MKTGTSRLMDSHLVDFTNPNANNIKSGSTQLPQQDVDKFEKFLDNEIELGLSPKDTIERIKWYYKTYFKQPKKD